MLPLSQGRGCLECCPPPMHSGCKLMQQASRQPVLTTLLVWRCGGAWRTGPRFGWVGVPATGSHHFIIVLHSPQPAFLPPH